MELLIVVGVLAVLAAIAISTVSGTGEDTRVSQLEADVATINRAVSVYRTNGGSIAGNLPPSQVLAKLKTAAAGKYPGFSGSVIDTRLVAVMQTGAEASSGAERAIWDSGQAKFVIATTGANGVQRFNLDDSIGADDFGTETRAMPIQVAQNDSWVWDYQEVAAAAPNAGVRPGKSAEGDGIDLNRPDAVQLNPPIFSPGSGNYALNNFNPKMAVTLSHTNPSSAGEIWYIQNGEEKRYDGGDILVSPEEIVYAKVKSVDDTAVFVDSETEDGNFQPSPHALSVSVNLAQSSLTYAQAGGQMTAGAVKTPEPARVSLDVGDTPSQFVDSSKFNVHYTVDGSTPTSSSQNAGNFSGGAYVPPSVDVSIGNWGTASSLTVSARAIAAAAQTPAYFLNSTVDSKSVSISRVTLGTPTIDPPSGQKAVDLPVSIAVNEAAGYPTGYRIYYTTNDVDPGDSNGEPVTGTFYDGQFNAGSGTNGKVIVTARVYGPAGKSHWFTPSAPVAVEYNTITVAEGALVGSANLNGTFVGSLIYASPASGGTMNNITFNSNATIQKGNLYLPGTPTIRRTNGTVWSPSTDGNFANQILGWEFDAAGERTVQTTPRVLNENGSITPDNYAVTFNNSAVLEGKVIRRHDAPAFPTIPPPPPADSNGSTSLNNPTGPISASQYSSVTINSSNVGDVRLLPGNYRNLTANNGTAFVLGDPANPEVTQYYSFQSLNLNSSSDIKVVGKVIVTVSGTINLNSGSVLGDPNHPNWLQLQFSSGGLNANSGSSMYAQLVAPTGSINFNAGSVFQGSVTANSLTINSDSVVFNLPPVIEN